MPLKINPGAPHFDSNIFWRYSQHLIKSRDCFFVTPQGLVSKGGLLEYRKIARVQFQSLLHLIERLPPTALPSIDVAGQQRNPRLVRQCASGRGAFLAGTVVVLIGPRQMLRDSEVSLTRISAQIANRLNRRFR